MLAKNLLLHYLGLHQFTYTTVFVSKAGFTIYALRRSQEFAIAVHGIRSINFGTQERSNEGLQTENKSVPRMPHLLARSGLSE